MRKLLLRNRKRAHSLLLKKSPRQRQSELQKRMMKLTLQDNKQPNDSGEPGTSASDQGSTSPVLEHHLVTKSQKRFLQSPYFLLRKYVISVTERLLRCLNTGLSDTEYSCSYGCLAEDGTKNHRRKQSSVFFKTNTCF